MQIHPQPDIKTNRGRQQLNKSDILTNFSMGILGRIIPDTYFFHYLMGDLSSKFVTFAK